MYTPNHHATDAHLSGLAYSESLIELVTTLFCLHATAVTVMHLVVYGFHNREPEPDSVYVTAAPAMGPADTFTGGGLWEQP